MRDWAFTPAALAELTRLHRAVLRLPKGIERDVLRLALLCVVEQSSQATKDGFAVKALWIARRKGVAVQQRSRFKTVPASRETVLLLEA